MHFIYKTPEQNETIDILKLKDQVRLDTYQKLIENLKEEDVKYKKSYEERAVILIDEISDNKGVIFCAYEKATSEKAGYIKCSLVDHTVEIRSLFILPKYQGLGIGTELINLIEKHYSTHPDVYNFSVNVLTVNTKALEFYRKLNFKIDKKITSTKKIGGKKYEPSHTLYKLKNGILEKYLQSSRLILKNLDDRGVPIVNLDPVSNSYVASIEGNYTYLRGILTPLNTLSASSLANDKLMSKKMMQLCKIPTPDYLCFSTHKKYKKSDDDVRKLLSEFLNMHPRIIAKPQNGLKSRDVFLNITNVEEALEAYNHIVNKNYKGVLFENFIEGDVHRVLLVDGKLVAGLRREKGYILADGINDLKTLIENKNNYLNHGGRNVGRIEVTEKLGEILKDQGYESLNSIPQKDAKIFTEIDFSNLETVSEITNDIDRNLVTKLSKFAKSVGLNLTGIDVISTDISDETKCSIIEINKEPAIDFHHYPDHGNPINVAGEIADAIIKKYL